MSKGYLDILDTRYVSIRLFNSWRSVYKNYIHILEATYSGHDYDRGFNLFLYALNFGIGLYVSLDGELVTQNKE